MTARVMLYTRQSKDSKASIKRQKTELTERANERGWDIRDVLEDGKSASRFNKSGARDAWTFLLAMISRGETDVVSMWESSRGSRELEEWAGFLNLCRTHHVLIDILTHEREPYDMENGKDWKSLADDGVDSAYESEKTSKRLRSQAKMLAAAGKPNGKLIFGYTRIYGENREFIAQPEKPEEANLIREAAKKFSEGQSLRSIAKDFDARSILTPAGVVGWSSTAVRRLIENRAYLGERWHNGAYAGKAVWPAILDLEVFNSCQERLNGYKANHRGESSAVAHFLSGVAQCQHGYVMQITKNRGIEYYKSKDFCTQIKKAELEDYVADEVRSRMLKVKADGRKANHNAVVAQAKAEVGRLEALIADVDESVRKGKMTLERGLKMTEQSERDLEAARKVADSAPPSDFPIILKNAGIEWFGMTVQQRQELTRSMLTVTILPVGRVGRYGAPPVETRVVLEDIRTDAQAELDAQTWEEQGLSSVDTHSPRRYS